MDYDIIEVLSYLEAEPSLVPDSVCAIRDPPTGLKVLDKIYEILKSGAAHRGYVNRIIEKCEDFYRACYPEKVGELMGIVCALSSLVVTPNKREAPEIKERSGMSEEVYSELKLYYGSIWHDLAHDDPMHALTEIGEALTTLHEQYITQSLDEDDISEDALSFAEYFSWALSEVKDGYLGKEVSSDIPMKLQAERINHIYKYCYEKGAEWSETAALINAIRKNKDCLQELEKFEAKCRKFSGAVRDFHLLPSLLPDLDWVLRYNAKEVARVIRGLTVPNSIPALTLKRRIAIENYSRCGVDYGFVTDRLSDVKRMCITHFKPREDKKEFAPFEPKMEIDRQVVKYKNLQTKERIPDEIGKLLYGECSKKEVAEKVLDMVKHLRSGKCSCLVPCFVKLRRFCRSLYLITHKVPQFHDLSLAILDYVECDYCQWLAEQGEFALNYNSGKLEEYIKKGYAI